MKMTKMLVYLLIMIAAAGVVSAVNLEITSLEINNKDLDPTSGVLHDNNYKYERGEDLEVDVCVKALADVTDVQIEADIYGYRYSNKEDTVSDTTDTFDLDTGDRDCHTLSLKVPERMDVDYYKLRVRVADRDGASLENMYQLHVKGIDRESAVQIKDFSINPEEVIAGRAFTSMVKVRNYGTTDLEDLKVTVSIPELNIKVSEFMDDLDADESKTFEELLLRVPECTKPGDYDVEIQVDFDEYETTTAGSVLKVLASDACGATAKPGTDGRSVITVPGSQEVGQGQGVVYPIMISNTGSSSKTYTISVSGASGWATAKIDPSAVVIVNGGQSKTAYLYLSADKDAELGDKVMTLTIDDGTESKQVALTAKVTKAAGSDWSDVKKGLEIGLIILVIVLIVIGLIIGFNKLKGNKHETEPYY